MPSFIFGGNTGLTYKDLKRLRDQSLARIGQDAPSLGSGIRDAGSAIASMIYNSKAKEVGAKEDAEKQEAQNKFNEVVGGFFKPQQPSTPEPKYEQPDFTQSQAMAEKQITREPLGDIGQGAKKQYIFDDNVENAIKTASNKHGVDADTLAMITQIESGGNPNAKNPNSSASGLMQFTKGTASQYGLQDPMDVNQNADAGARLTLDNQRALEKSLGRMPTKEELYLAHQQGIGGATALLANPQKKALDSLSQVYKNPETAKQAIINNGGSLDMTAGDFANKWIGKAKQYNDYSLNPSQQPQQSEPMYFPSELPQGQIQEQPQEEIQQENTMQRQAMPTADFSKILPFLSNPNLSEGQRLIANKMIQNQMSKLFPDAMTEAKLKGQELQNKGYSQQMTINEQNQALRQQKYEQEMQLANAKSEQEAVKFQNDIRQTEANINKLNAQASNQYAQTQNASRGTWGQPQTLIDAKTQQPVSVRFNNLTGEQQVVDGYFPKKELTPLEIEQQKQTIAAQDILPQAREQFDIDIKNIKSLRNDPNLGSAFGVLDSRLPTLSQGTANVEAKIEQLKGGAFLTAFEKLKGSGQITEIEGVKATNALLRANNAQSETEFQSALNDYQTIVESALKRLENKAKGGQPFMGGGNKLEDPLGIR